MTSKLVERPERELRDGGQSDTQEDEVSRYQVLPVVTIDSTALASAQSRVKGQVKDLAGEAHIWGVSASFLARKWLYLSVPS